MVLESNVVVGDTDLDASDADPLDRAIRDLRVSAMENIRVLGEKICELRTENTALRSIGEDLLQANGALEKENAELRAQITRLNREHEMELREATMGAAAEAEHRERYPDEPAGTY